MTDENKYLIIKTTLTILKIPEIAATAGIVLGLIGVFLWSWEINIVLAAIIIRLGLFLIRLALISKKREIEKKSMSFLVVKK